MLAATQDTRTHSQSPSRPSLTEKISALGSKLSRTLTGGESTVHGEEDRDSVASLDVQKDRSRSRGRDLLQSTGRGGFGNIRQPSASRDRPADGPDDFSVTRGREPNPLTNPNVMYSTGRGGAGNLRSPSRDASKGPDAREREVIKEYAQHHGEIPASTGRGGLGNINRSRSRDPNLGANLVSSGRGGAGNIHANEGGYNANAADESERKRHEGLHAEGFHSTGRGGFANITESHEPAVERPAVVPNPAAYHSSGRGGAGNIHTGA